MIKMILGFALVSALSIFANGENLPSLQSIRENNKGVDQLKASNIQMSQELFIQALQANPHSPEIQLNLGVTFAQQSQPEKAEAAYQTALKLAKDDKNKFAALFNLGELAQKAKKKEQALDYYQQALKFDPHSLETKINIELLAQSGKGGGDGKDDQKQDDKDKDKQDKKDQSGDGDDKKEQEPKDGNKDKDKEDQKKQPSKGKPQPKQFKSQELSQSDVNKILDELKQQEQKIRAEFNRRESKEKPRDKDW